MDLGLQDATVLVSGGSSGIGKATALAFAGAGAHVAITYYQGEAGAQAVVQQIEKYGVKGFAVPMDLGNGQSIEQAAQAVVERFKSINVLVNNAVVWPTGLPGAGGFGTPFEAIDPEHWQKVIEVDLVGPFRLTRALVPAMRQAKWGRIVTISTNLVDAPLPGGSAYVSAKMGLHGLSKSLARDLAPDGILSNVVKPGFTVTDKNLQKFPDTVRDGEAKLTPTGRLSTPEDIARTVVYLGSQANGHVNGEVIAVTGGH